MNSNSTLLEKMYKTTLHLALLNRLRENCEPSNAELVIVESDMVVVVYDSPTGYCILRYYICDFLNNSQWAVFQEVTNVNAIEAMRKVASIAIQHTQE